MLRRTIDITIELHEDGFVRIDSTDTESGYGAYLEVNDPTDERDKEYITNMFGSEIYSWVMTMVEEREAEQC